MYTNYKIATNLILGYFWILQKGRRPYPVGTIQNRKDGRYRKKSERKWEKLPSLSLGQVVKEDRDVFQHMNEMVAFTGRVIYRNLENTENFMMNSFGRILQKEELSRLACIFRKHTLIVETVYDENGEPAIYLLSWDK